MKRIFVSSLVLAMGICSSAEVLTITQNPQTVNVDAATLEIDAITLANDMGAGCEIIKTGSGELKFSGSNASNFGKLTIKGGTVQVSNADNLGSGDVVLDGGTFKVTDTFVQGNRKFTVLGHNSAVEIAEGKRFDATTDKFDLRNATLTQKGKGIFYCDYWNAYDNIKNAKWIIADGGVMHRNYTWRNGMANLTWGCFDLEIRKGGILRIVDVGKVVNVTLRGGKIQVVYPKTIDGAEYSFNSNNNTYSLINGKELPEIDNPSPMSRGVAFCGTVTVEPEYDDHGNVVPSEIECPMGAELANASHSDSVFDVKEGAVLVMNAVLYNGKQVNDSNIQMTDRDNASTVFCKMGKGEMRFNKGCSVDGTFNIMDGVVSVARNARFASTVTLNAGDKATVRLADGSALACDAAGSLMAGAEVWLDPNRCTGTNPKSSTSIVNNRIPNWGTAGGDFHKLGSNNWWQIQESPLRGGNMTAPAQWEFKDYPGEEYFGGPNKVFLSWGNYSGICESYTNRSDEISVFLVTAFNMLDPGSAQDWTPLSFSNTGATSVAKDTPGGLAFYTDCTISFLDVKYGGAAAWKYAGAGKPNTAAQNPTPCLMTTVRRGTTATSTVYKHDGLEVGTNVVTGLSANLNIDRIALGAMLEPGGTITNPRFYGRIGEVIVFSRALSDDEVLKVENYLKRKWFNSKAEELPESHGVNMEVAGGDAAAYSGNGDVAKTGDGVLALGGAQTAGLSVRAGKVEMKNGKWKTKAAIWMDPSDEDSVTLNNNSVTAVRNKGYAGGAFTANTRGGRGDLQDWVTSGVPYYMTDAINGLNVLEFRGRQALVLNSYTNRTVRDLHVYGIYRSPGFVKHVTEDWNDSDRSTLFSFASDELTNDDLNCGGGAFTVCYSGSPSAKYISCGRPLWINKFSQDGAGVVDLADYNSGDRSNSGVPYLAIAHSTYAHMMYAQVTANDENLNLPYELGPRGQGGMNIFDRRITDKTEMEKLNVNLVQLGNALVGGGAAGSSGNCYHSRALFGQIGEFIAFDSELTREEERELIAYLRKKWFDKGDASGEPPACLAGETLAPGMAESAQVSLSDGIALESSVAKQSVASLNVGNGVEWIRTSPAAESDDFGFFNVSGDAVIGNLQNLVFSPEPGTSADIVTAGGSFESGEWTARIAGKEGPGEYGIVVKEKSVRLVYKGGMTVILR